MKKFTNYLLVLLSLIMFLNNANAQYCTSIPKTDQGSECDVVQLAGNTITLNKNTTSVCASYSDFTSGENVPDLQAGFQYTINITQGTCGTTENRVANAWIDFTQDNDFSDANEMLGAGTVVSSTNGYIHSYTFTVPLDAVLGNTRLRVMVVKGSAAVTSGCKNNYSSGETEDYTVNIVVYDLPITLLYFDAKFSNNKTKLNWQTASEINNDYFTIERSNNKINWEYISQVEGAGNNNGILSYESVDNNPLIGVSYYRLKQTDFDGKFSYSNIVAVSSNETSSVSIFPNPANDFITIENIDVLTENIRIYNTFGLDVTSLIKLDIQSEKTVIIDLSRLSKGLYMIKTQNTTNKIYKQ